MSFIIISIAWPHWGNIKFRYLTDLWQFCITISQRTSCYIATKFLSFQWRSTNHGLSSGVWTKYIRRLSHHHNTCSVFTFTSSTSIFRMSTVAGPLLLMCKDCYRACPRQWRLLTRTGSMPRPKCAFFGTNWALPQPSCWQTTWASFSHQLLSHTVPHWPLWKISSLPEQLLLEDYHSQMVMAGCLHRAQRIKNNMYPSTTLLFVWENQLYTVW